MTKATGLDSVSARLLRECPDLISGSLALIFNQSIDTGIFPDEWKNARITPLFKKAGNRSDPSNYRPISIVRVVAKVFEPQAAQAHDSQARAIFFTTFLLIISLSHLIPPYMEKF